MLWMGRKPIGRKPLTKAQVQQRWRRKRNRADQKATRQAQHAARVAAMEATAEQASAELAGLGKLYSVILADPPWDVATYSEKGKNRHASRHYETMPTDAIAEIKVPAAPDAVLFLWATVQMLEHGLRVMAAWGFTYKSLYIWRKTGRGHGYWSMKDQAELLLIGTRGKRWVALVRGDQPPQVALAEMLDEAPMEVAPRGEHSAKPEVFYSEIERMYPHVQKVEMFARRERDGWDAWGNEVSQAAAA